VGHGRSIMPETQHERSLLVQTGAPLIATVHVIPSCTSRAGLGPVRYHRMGSQEQVASSRARHDATCSWEASLHDNGD
jgi:hypothetical protein